MKINAGNPETGGSNADPGSLGNVDPGAIGYVESGTPGADAGAQAYSQGQDIHLGSGSEQHLGHEAWHVVQQKQGRTRGGF